VAGRQWCAGRRDRPGSIGAPRQLARPSGLWHCGQRQGDDGTQAGNAFDVQLPAPSASTLARLMWNTTADDGVARLVGSGRADLGHPRQRRRVVLRTPRRSTHPDVGRRTTGLSAGSRETAVRALA
jgi:hypothetical protein